jgi:hypothetical protein
MMPANIVAMAGNAPARDVVKPGILVKSGDDVGHSGFAA